MKKLLIAITFAVLGLSASANTKEIKKIDLSQSTTSVQKVSPTRLQITFDCGTYTVTVCCFDTYLDAEFYAYYTDPC